MAFGRKVLAVLKDSAFALDEIHTHYSKQSWYTWPSPTPLYAVEQKIRTSVILACISKLTRGGESLYILCLVLF